MWADAEPARTTADANECANLILSLRATSELRRRLYMRRGRGGLINWKNWSYGLGQTDA